MFKKFCEILIPTRILIKYPITITECKALLINTLLASKKLKLRKTFSIFDNLC